MPGRWAWTGLQISIVQSAGRELASSTARSPTTMAEPMGAAENSSSRVHCTRTVRFGVRIATKAASNAASSAELCP